MKLTVWSKFKLEEFMSKLSLVPNVISYIKVGRHPLPKQELRSLHTEIEIPRAPRAKYR